MQPFWLLEHRPRSGPSSGCVFMYFKHCEVSSYCFHLPSKLTNSQTRNTEKHRPQFHQANNQAQQTKVAKEWCSRDHNVTQPAENSLSRWLCRIQVTLTHSPRQPARKIKVAGTWRSRMEWQSLLSVALYRVNRDVASLFLEELLYWPFVEYWELTLLE